MSKPLSPADEGTIAHKLLELCVRKGLCSPLLFVAKTITVEGEDKQHSILSPSGAGRFLKCMGSIVEKREEGEPREDISAEVTLEMANAVEIAVDYIRSVKKDMVGAHIEPEYEVWLECLDFRGEDGHGTIDVLLYDDYEVHVMDYKHGRGVAVEVDDNDQTKLYSVGVLDTKKHTGKKWWNHILQPRSPHPDGPCRKIGLGYRDLTTYRDGVDKQVKSYNPKTATYNPGSWCKWCPKAPCEAMAKAAVEVARSEFGDFLDKKEDTKLSVPGKMTSKQLAIAMSKVNLLKMFVSSVEEEVFGRLQKNEDKILAKSYKLVEGKSNRAWANEDKVISEFKKLKIDPDLYAPRKLVGIGIGEDLIPKTKREKLMKKLTIKPTGKAVIAPFSDPRKALCPNSAGEDFANHIEPQE